MITYQPVAHAFDSNGNAIHLFCQDSAFSIEDCVKQFEVWEEGYGYKIMAAQVWVIDDADSKVIDFEKKWVACS